MNGSSDSGDSNGGSPLRSDLWSGTTHRIFNHFLVRIVILGAAQFQLGMQELPCNLHRSFICTEAVSKEVLGKNAEHRTILQRQYKRTESERRIKK